MMTEEDTNRSSRTNSKRKPQPKLNDSYARSEFRDVMSSVFSNKGNNTFHHETGCILHKEPFSCCEMPTFIEDDEFLKNLKDELLDQIFIEKSNDLYKFQQTDDLKKIKTPNIQAFRKLFKTEVLEFMRAVTGIPLTETVDLTCSKYDHTDVLLCHDDELEGRRIAFILYLVPPWDTADGGALDLFSMDENGQPKDIVKSILPAWNKFAWFEVTEASHHQVAEVLSEDKCRLSVNGWFHGPPITRPPTYVEPPLPLRPYGDIDEDQLYNWINPIYLEPGVQGEIQEKFEADSEIELQGFFKEEKYEELVNVLKSTDILWNNRGPYNKRHYEVMEQTTMPSVVQECLQLLQSEAMFLILSNLTGLRLHELAPNSDFEEDAEAGDGDAPGISKPKRPRLSSTDAANSHSDTCGGVRKPAEVRSEVRKWSQGCYTLVHDTDTDMSEYALDAMFFSACPDWKQEYGGYTSYIAKGEDEELLTVVPAENSLALVYRDRDTMRFVKHINAKSREVPEFYDFSLTYYE